jgi:hypothetical protein
MTKYPFNLTATGSIVIETAGKFLYYESGVGGSADTSIKVVMPGAKGGELILQIGQGFKIPESYERLIVSNNLGQGTITGQLVIADGEFFDHRVIGTVSVVDGGYNRTKLNQAFMLGVAVPAVAAQVSECQLWNPPASTKNLIVKKVVMSVTASSQINMGGNAVTLPIFGGAPGTKNISSGTASQGTGRINNAAANSVLVNMGVINLPANTVYLHEFDEPVLIPPGAGLVIATNVFNLYLLCSFEFFESPLGA